MAGYDALYILPGYLSSGRDGAQKVAGYKIFRLLNSSTYKFDFDSSAASLYVAGTSHAVAMGRRLL